MSMIMEWTIYYKSMRKMPSERADIDRSHINNYRGALRRCAIGLNKLLHPTRGA
jgi:hypothetical protein